MDRIKKLGGWLLENFSTLAWLASLVGSFTVPAWAAKMTGGAFHSPIAWVAAGACGMIIWAGVYSAYAWARGRIVRARYDAKLLAQGGEIDPLARIFEKKRIFLNEFVLPSHPLIEDKTFIDCEIIGPASVILNVGNNIDNHRLPYCDAYVMRNRANPYNGYIANRCTFRGCNFIRVSLMFSLAEYETAKNVEWLNWVSIRPDHLDEAALLAPAPADEQKPTEAREKRHWPWQKK